MGSGRHFCFSVWKSSSVLSVNPITEQIIWKKEADVDKRWLYHLFFYHRAPSSFPLELPFSYCCRPPQAHALRALQELTSVNVRGQGVLVVLFVKGLTS